MRLIDADVMIESVKQQCSIIRLFGRGDLILLANTLEEGFLQEIKNAPTIEAEPVRKGTWIDEGYYANNTNVKAWHCSECNWHTIGYDDELFRYCPMCGADMRGADDEDC